MGSGQSVSFVDNVVQRERHTSYPTLWSSGIKGVVRELAYRHWNDKDKVNVIFGPEDGSDQYASCISITDAKILLFPVRSVKGTFAWITCPFVLKRLVENLKSIGKNLHVEIPSIDDKKVVVGQNSVLKIDGNQVAFEEFVFDVDSQNSHNVAEEIFHLIPQTEFDKNFFKNHFAIVSDDVFKDFVNYAVEIRTRIRIDQATGTVKEGALFSEELIPSESVFYSLVFISEPYTDTSNLNSANDVLREVNSLFSNNSILQLGGDETLGKGFVKLKFEAVNTNQGGQSHGGQNP
jgi:CRISPR-associated protein Cmr4